MITIRSLIFFFLLILWILLVGILSLPFLLSKSPKTIVKIGSFWSKGILILLRYICGLEYKISGKKNLPSTAYIVASKHQSMWETFFLTTIIPNATFILKQELTNIPFVGWYLKKSMISIARSSAIKAMRKINEDAVTYTNNGHHIIIFPEGTRTAFGSKPDLKSGIYAIHQAMPEAVVVPISHNAGKYWPGKNPLRIKPGVVQVQIGQPMRFIKEKNIYLDELKSAINQL